VGIRIETGEASEVNGDCFLNEKTRTDRPDEETDRDPVKRQCDRSHFPGILLLKKQKECQRDETIADLYHLIREQEEYCERIKQIKGSPFQPRDAE
jgi:hypothetical protein